jgi:hypothetical protein
MIISHKVIKYLQFKIMVAGFTKSDFLTLKSIFRLYNPFLYGVMTYQNVHLDPIFHNIELKKDLDAK